MASGDLFADMFTTVTTGGVDIQPAVGVSAMITLIACDGASCEIEGKNSGGSVEWQLPSSTGSTDDLKSMLALPNCRIFINNNEFLVFKTASGTRYYSYTGIEI
tara:strand:- start:363 stop:674 length:312 start_codon:yes stop_codon:yes gene_type:complete